MYKHIGLLFKEVIKDKWRVHQEYFTSYNKNNQWGRKFAMSSCIDKYEKQAQLSYDKAQIRLAIYAEFNYV